MKIIFSCGDINGIGIEAMLKALDNFFSSSKFAKDAEFTLAIHPETLYRYAFSLKYKLKIGGDHFIFKGQKIKIIPCENNPEIKYGKITKEAGSLAAESIQIALDGIAKNEFDAFVTLPIHKESIYKTGWEFPGHTEMIADKFHEKDPLMVLCTQATRVALVTIHEPIKNVPNLITSDRIYERGIKFCKSLKIDYGLKNPTIAVLGLNPHSGEGGTMGNEEETIIKPAMKRLKEAGVSAAGPFPADGFFAHGSYLRYDGILAMYHDQGLIPLKLIAMGAGVNFTAGLPIVRTSPDHGTGFDIAGKNIADERSTLSAIELAAIIAKNRAKSNTN